MNTEILAYLAGTISSFIFMSSNVPMLWKVFKTKDMHSYSILNLVLVNEFQAFQNMSFAPFHFFSLKAAQPQTAL